MLARLFERFLALTLACALVLYPALARALPQGGTVVSGRATITQTNPQTLNINQTTNKAIINWNGFNIDVNQLVQFNQPGSRSVALNRITDQNPTTILGNLVANGRVFIVNPNGIFFGAKSVVDVSGLLATTFDIKDNDFLSGNYLFQQDPSKPLSYVINKGQIKVSDDGFVFLVAPGVANEGLIIANLGKAVLGSGERLVIDFMGDGLINFVLDGKVMDRVVGPDGLPLSSAVANSGTIRADGGQVILSARASGDIFSSVVNNSGVIEARSLVGRGGSIRLEGSDPVENTGEIGWQANLGKVQNASGAVVSTGTLDVSAAEKGAAQGEVTLTGQFVGVSGAILARGADGAQGGRVLITSTDKTVLTSSALIDTSGVGNSSAGNVVVWSDKDTIFSGTILARGGDLGGNGGNVEVSGHGRLGFFGAVDLSARRGTAGTLLLDPDDLCVSVATPTACGGGSAVEDTTNPFQAINGVNSFFVKKSTLEALGITINVLLQASNDVIFETDLAMTQTTGTVAVTAGNAITMAGFNLSTSGGAVTLTAGAGGITNLGTISTGGGTLTLNSSGTITQNATDVIGAGAGALVKLGAGTLILSRPNTYTGVTTISAGVVNVLNNTGLGTVAGATTVASGAALNIDGAGLTIAEPITSLIGTGVSGGGALRNLANANTWSGAITLGTGGARINSDSGAVLTLSGGITTVGNLLTIGGAGDTTFSTAAIAGSGGLTKDGAGTLTLGFNNTYTGVTTINAGTVSIATSDTRLGAAPGTLAPAQLTLDGGTLLVTTAGLALSVNRGIQLNAGGGTISISTGTTSTAANISGVGSLTKAGAGTLSLTGTSNNYAGATTISAGTLQVGIAGGTIPDTSAVTVTGTLDLNTFSETIGSLAGGGTVTSSAAGAVTLTAGGNNSSTTFSGVIQNGSGTVSLTKTGSGTLILTGANTYTGATIVNTGTGTLTLSGSGTATGSSGFTVNAGATLALDNSVTNVADRIAGTLTLNGGNFTFTGQANTAVSETIGALTIGAGFGTITSNRGTGTGTNSLTFASVAARNAGGTVNFVAQAGGGGDTFDTSVNQLIFTSAPTLSNSILPYALVNGTDWATTSTNNIVAFSAYATTFVGATATSNVKISADEATLGALAINSLIIAGTTTVTITVATTLTIQGTSATIGPVLTTGSNASITGGTALSFGTAEGVFFTQGSTGSSTATLSSPLTAASSGGFTKSGAGTLTLSSATAAAFTGATFVGGGTFLYGDNNQIGAGTVTVAGGTLNLATFTDTVGAVTLTSGSITGTTGILTGTSYAVLSGTISAILAGAVALTKTTTDTVTLSGTNTYTGATTISGGALRVQSNAALGGTGTGTTVASGAALEIDGSGLSIAEPITSLIGNGISLGGALRNLANSNTWSGAITLGGSARITSDSGTLTISTGGITGATQPLIVSGAGDTSITAAIGTTTGTLTKTGTGTLTLDAANTYTGATTIRQGVIRVKNNTALGTTAGTTTVVSGAAIEIDGTGLLIAEPIISLAGTGVSSGGALRNLANSNTWSGAITVASSPARINSDSGTLTLSGGVTNGGILLTIGGAGDTTFSTVAITGAGGLTKDGVGTLTLNFANTYTGLTTVSAGTLAYGVNDALSTGAVTVSGGTLALSTFNDTNIGAVTLSSGSITGSTGVLTSTSGFTVESGTISAIIAGAVALTKNTTGSVTLSGVNTYTGTTTINAGTLVVGANAPSGGAGALGNAASAVIVGGTGGTDSASLLIGGAFTVGRDVTARLGSTGTTTLGGSTAASSIYSGAITLAKDVTLTAVNLGTSTFSGVISESGGSRGITKTDSGTVVLSSTSNSYTGATTISAGTLQLGNAGVIPDASAVTVTGTLDLNTFSETIGSLAGGGTVDTVAGGTPTLTAGGDNTSTTFSGVIQNTAGTLALTKTGSGTLTLSGASPNTYAGATTVSAGTLIAAKDSALGTVGGITTVSSGATLGFSGGINYSTAEAVTVNGTGDAGNSRAGAIDNISGSNTFAGAITLGSNATIGSTAGALTLTGGVVGASDITFNVVGVSTIEESGVISGVGTNVIKNGAGELTFSGGSANTYTGTTTVNAGTLLLNKTAGVNAIGGNLVIGNDDGTQANDVVRLLADNQIPNSSTVTVTSSGHFDLDGFDETIGALNLKSGTTSFARVDTGSGTLTLGGDVTLTIFGTGAANAQIAGNLDLGGATRTFTIANAGLGFDDLELFANISGTGAGIIKAGPGVMKVEGANTYDGATTINAGTFKLGNDNVIPDGSLVTVKAGATFDLDGNSDTIGALTLESGAAAGATVTTGAGTLTLGGDVTLNSAGGGAFGATISGNLDLGGVTRTFTVANGAAANDLAISAVISNGALTKDGLGKLTLSGVNTYAGITTLSAGTLRAEGVSALSSGASDLALNGGTLELATDASIFGNNTTVGGNVIIIVDRLTAGAGVTHTLGTLSIGANTLTVQAGSNVTSGTAGLTFGLTTLTGGATLSPDTGTLLTVGSVTGVGQALTVAGAGDTTLSGGLNTGVLGTLTKNGAGTLTISAAGTYTGGTFINAGVVSIGADNRLGAAPGSPTTNITFDGGTLKITGAGFTLDANRTIQLAAGGGTIDVQANLVSGNSFTGTGALTLTGIDEFDRSAALNLGGAFTITGNVTYDASQFDVTTTVAGLMTISGSAFYDAGNTSTFNGGLTMTGGQFANPGANALIVDVNGNFTQSGGTFNAPGTMTVSGDFDRSGGGTFTHNSGTVNLDGAGGSTQTISGDTTFNNLTATVTTTGRTLEFAAGSTQTIAGTLTFQGLDASNRLVLKSTVNTSQWFIDAQGATTLDFLQVRDSNAITALTATNSIEPDNNNTNWTFGAVTTTWEGDTSIAWGDANNWTGNVLPSATINAIIPDAAGTTFDPHVTASETARALTLDSGALLFIDANSLTLNNVLSMAGATITMAAGTTLTLGGNVSVTGTSSITGASGTVALGATRTFTVDPGVSLSIAPAISGGFGVGITKMGDGTLTLSGNNTYEGATNINAGILVVKSSNALGTTDDGTTVDSGAELRIDGTGLSIPEEITINGTGTGVAGALRNMTGSNTLTGAITLGSSSTIGVANGTSLTFTNTISGAGFDLDVTAGTGNITLAQVGVDAAELNSLTINSGNLTLTGNVHAVTQDYTGATSPVTINGMVTLDANDGVSNGTINFGARNIVRTNAGDTLTLDAFGALGSIILADVGTGGARLDSLSASAATVTLGSAFATNSTNLVADALTFTAINAGTGKLTVAPFTPGTLIKVGNGATNRVDFDANFFLTTNITAGILQIGNTDNTGGITVAGNFSPGFATLHLATGGSISDANTTGRTITATNLALEAANGIGAGGANNAIDIAVTNLAASNSTVGGIALKSAGAVNIPDAGVDGVTGLSAAGQTISLAIAGGITTDTGAAFNITADTLILDVTGTPIGTSGDPLRTTVSFLEIIGTPTGVFIDNTGDLTLQGAAVTTTGGGIHVGTHSALTINTDQSDTGGGDLEFAALGNLVSDILTVAANLTVSGGAGTGKILLWAGSDILHTTGTISSTGGEIKFFAGVDRGTVPPAAAVPAAGFADGAVNQSGGSVTSNSGNISIRGTGNVTILNVSSTTGKITLGADAGFVDLGLNESDGVGTLTLSPAANVTTSSTATDAITLQAAAIDISGTATVSAAGAGGGIRLFTSDGTQSMEIGGAGGATFNVSDAELARLTTMDTLTIGESGVQTQDITFVTAAPASNPNIIVNQGGAGEIVLNDGGAATALNAGSGTISLTAGSGGITATNATNGFAEIATTGATVTLNTSGPIGSSPNRIEFANATTAQQNVVIGDVTQPSSAFLHGLGTVTLGAIKTAGDLDVTAVTAIVLKGNIATDFGVNAGNVTLTGAVTLAANVLIDTDSPAGTDGDVTFTSTINADNSTTADRTLTITAGAGTAEFQGNIGAGVNGALADLDVTAGQINLNGATIQVDDAAAPATVVTFTGPVVLGADVTVDTLGGGVAANSVTFTGTITSDVAGQRSLSINGGTTNNADVTLAQVGSATNWLKSLTVSTESALNLGGDIFTDNNVGSGLVLFSGGPDIVLNSDVTINSDANGNASGGAVSFSSFATIVSSVAGDSGLNITAGNGTVSLPPVVGTIAKPLEFLTVTTSGPVNVRGSIVTDDNVGTGNVDFSGATGGIRLNADLTINTDAGNGGTGGFVNLSGSTVTSLGGAGAGDNSLTITAGNGAVTLGQVGSVAAYLEALTVTTTGLTTLGGDIFTDNNIGTGNVIFSAATGGITLGNSIAINTNASGIGTSGGAVNLSGSTVDATTAGVEGLTINAADGTVTLADIGTGTALGALDVNGGAIKLNGADIITKLGTVDFTGPITLGTSVSIDTTDSGGSPAGASINFNNAGTTINATTSGMQGLTLNAGTGGTVMFEGDVGATKNLAYLAVTAGDTQIAALVDISTAAVDGPITFTNDDIFIDPTATINAGAGTVTIQQNTAARPIDLGTNTGGTLGLTDAELDTITAGTLRIGDPANTGDITITSQITAPAGWNKLHLRTGGAIIDANGTNPDITVTNLILTAVNGIAAGGGGGFPQVLETDVTNLQATNTNNGIEISNVGPLTLADLDSLGYAVQNTMGGVTIYSGGTLTVNAAVSAGRKIELETGSSADILVNANITATAASAVRDIELIADRSVIQATGTTIENMGVGGEILVIADSAANGLGSITMNGTAKMVANDGDIRLGIVFAPGEGPCCGGGAGGGGNTQNITVGLLDAGAGQVRIRTEDGGIFGNGAAANNVVAADLVLRSEQGVDLVTAVSRLNIRNGLISGAGDIDISNTSGTLTLENFFFGAGPAAVRNDGGAVTITNTGNLTVTNDVTAAGTISLTAGGVDKLLTNNAAISSTGANPITLIADKMDLSGGTVDAGPGIVTLLQKTNGRAFDLGSVTDAAAAVELSAAEIDNITAGTLRIGNANSGDITITAAIAPAGTNTLHLTTGGAIIDGNAAGDDITETNLALTSGTGIGASGNPLEIAVTNLAAKTTTSGSIFITESDGLSVTTVDSVTGITTAVTGGGDLIKLISTTGDISVKEVITAGSSGAGDDVALIATAGKILQGTAGKTVSGDQVLLKADTGIGATTAPVEVSSNKLAAQTTTSGSIFLKEVSADGTAVDAVTIDGVTVTGISTANSGADSIRLDSTTGSITVAEDITAGAAGAGDDVLIVSAAQILLGASGDVITGDQVALKSATGIGASGSAVEVSSNKLAASTTTSGKIFLKETSADGTAVDAVTIDGVTVTGISTANSGADSIRLDSTTGSITVAEDITAGAAGAGDDVLIVSAAQILLGATGDVITGNQVALKSATGIGASGSAVEVSSNKLAAQTTTSGSIFLKETSADGTAVDSVTIDGVTVTGISTADSGADSIRLDSTTGSITVAEDITAGAAGAGDDVLIVSAAQILLGATGDVITGDQVALKSATGIGATTAAVEVSSNKLAASTTTSGKIFLKETSADGTSVDSVTIDGVTVTGISTFDVAAASNLIRLDSTTGDITIAEDITAGNPAEAGDDVLINSAAKILLGATGDVISGNSVALKSATGIGASGSAVEVSSNKLAASTTTSGQIFLTETSADGTSVDAVTIDGVTVTGISTANSGADSIRLDSTVGSITVAEDITAGAAGAGDDVLIVSAAQILLGATGDVITGDQVALKSATGIGATTAAVEVSSNKLAASTTTSGKIFLKETSADGTAVDAVTIDGVTVTGISTFDVAAASNLIRLDSTTGDITIAEDITAGNPAEAGDDVLINSAAKILLGATGDVISGNSVALKSATGIGASGSAVEVSSNKLAASTTTSGKIFLTETSVDGTSVDAVTIDGVTVTGISTANSGADSIRLDSTVGSITVAEDITAGAAGAGDDVLIVSAAQILLGTTGDVITGNQVALKSATGIGASGSAVEVSSNKLAAQTTTSGSIFLKETSADGTAVDSVTIDGVTVTGISTFDVAAASNLIRLDSTTGDITIAEDITAGNPAEAGDDVLIVSAAKILLGATGDVISGEAVALKSATGIGASGSAVEVSSNKLAASTTTSGKIFLTETSADGTSVDAVTIDGVTVTGISTANSGADSIRLDSTVGSITVAEDITAGAAGAGDDVLIVSAAQILLGTTGDVITGNQVALKSATGIGASGSAVEVSSNKLAAQTTTSGSIFLKETSADGTAVDSVTIDGVTVTGISTADSGADSIRLDSTTGSITVAEDITAGAAGAGDDVLIVSAAQILLGATGDVITGDQVALKSATGIGASGSAVEVSSNKLAAQTTTSGSIFLKETSVDGTAISDITLDGVTVTGISTIADVSLDSAGPVTQTAAITASGLELLGAGPYTLDLTTNDISTLAGDVTGAVTYRDANSFTVGTVNTTGLTAGDNVTLFADQAAASDVTVSENIIVNAGATKTLEIQANRSILFTNSADVNNGGSGQAVNVILNADRDADGVIGGAISLGSGTVIASNGGDITLGGGADPTTDPAFATAAILIGVVLDDTTLSAAGGNISIIGDGGSVLGGASGVLITNGSLVQTGGTGNITIDGTGGSMGAGAIGVAIEGATVQILAGGSGDINITGVGGGDGSGASNVGVSLCNCTGATLVNQLGSGMIAIDGTGGSGTGGDRGIILWTLLAAGNVTVQSNTGPITLTGTASTSVSAGVEFTEFSTGSAMIQVLSTGTATIDIIGTGAPGSFGTFFTNASSTTIGGATASGDILLRSLAGTGIGIGDMTTIQTTGNVTINAVGGGTVSQVAGSSIQATGLRVLGDTNPTITLTSATNNVDTLAADLGSTLSYRDADGFDIGSLTTFDGTGTTTTNGIMATTVTLNAGGAVTQSQAVMATGLELLGAAGAYTLNTVNNDVTTLAGNTGSVKFRDDNGFEIGTVNTMGLTTTGDVTLQSDGAVTQTEKLVASGLRLSGAGTYTLQDGSNDVVTLAADASGGDLKYTDVSGFDIGTVDGVSGINIGANDLTLTAGGTVTQSQAITASGLELLGASGTYNLDSVDNSVTTLAANTANLKFKDNTGFDVGTVTGTGTAGITATGNVTLSTTSTITQSQAINAAGLELAGGGTFTLGMTNDVDTLAVNTGAAFTFTDSDGLTVGTVGGTSGITTAGNDLILNTGGTITLSQDVDVGGATITLNPSAGGVSQTSGALTAANLLLTGAGTFDLNQAGNDVTTIAANVSGAVTYKDANDLEIGTVNATNGITTGGSDVTVSTVDGKLDVNQPVNAAGGNINLTTGESTEATNAIMTLAANITGNTVILTSADDIMQTGGVINAVGLALVSGSPITVTGANDVDILAALAGILGGDIQFNDINDLIVGGTVGTLTGVLSNGGIITITAGGMMTVIALNAGTGGVTLTTTAGDMTTGIFAAPFLASISGGNVILTVGGSLLDGNGNLLDINAATALTIIATGSIGLSTDGIEVTGPSSFSCPSANCLSGTNIYSLNINGQTILNIPGLANAQSTGECAADDPKCAGKTAKLVSIGGEALEIEAPEIDYEEELKKRLQQSRLSPEGDVLQESRLSPLAQARVLASLMTELGEQVEQQENRTVEQ